VTLNGAEAVDLALLFSVDALRDRETAAMMRRVARARRLASLSASHATHATRRPCQ
jgi:hypothetical protein